MNANQKKMYLLATKIRKLYLTIASEEGNFKKHLADLQFLLAEENKLYSSMSMVELSEAINKLDYTDVDGTDIYGIMLGDYWFDPGIRIINKLQYFLQIKGMFSEALEISEIPTNTLYNVRWCYLYNEHLFYYLFYYYRTFLGIRKQVQTPIFLSLLNTTYSYSLLEKMLLSFYEGKENRISLYHEKFSGIQNAYDEVSKFLAENLNDFLCDFLNSEFPLPFLNEQDADKSITEIFLLSLYNGIQNPEIKERIKQNFSPQNIPNLPLFYTLFLTELQQFFQLSDQDMQLKRI